MCSEKGLTALFTFHQRKRNTTTAKGDSIRKIQIPQEQLHSTQSLNWRPLGSPSGCLLHPLKLLSTLRIPSQELKALCNLKAGRHSQQWERSTVAPYTSSTHGWETLLFYLISQRCQSQHSMATPYVKGFEWLLSRINI